MDSAEGKALATWDRMSSTYDEVAKRMQYFEFCSRWLAEHIPGIATQAQLRVLDLGCGSGLNAQLLREGGQVIRADGVDISGSMLGQARARGGYDRLHEHDLNNPLTGLASEEFDLIIAFGCLEFLTDAYLCLSECRRLLRRGGTLWATFQRFEAGDTGSPPRTRRIRGISIRGHSAGEILHSMSQLGLRVVELKAVTGYMTQNGFGCPYYAVHAVSDPVTP